MKGRKPKPTHLKLVTGNPGKRRLNKSEPAPEQVMPPVPEHISDEAKAEWVRMSEQLYRIGLLTEIDGCGLACYCQAYADWAEAEGHIRRYGKVIKSPAKTMTRRLKDGSEVTETSGGYPIQSPFLAIRNRAVDTILKFLIEFGMTPSSRSRVSVGQPTGPNPFTDFN